MKIWLKLGIAFVVVAVVYVCLLLFYAPEHWLRQVPNFASVTIDDRPVHADMYIGNPTHNEAEAFLLVHVNSGGDYLLNFDGETFREVSSKEFVSLHWGALIFKPVSEGRWVAPRPFLNVNEFRLTSSTGHIVIVKF